jgi:hypothetical protein
MRMAQFAVSLDELLHRAMKNPWLNVPLADYEGHMSSAHVQQLGALSDLFAEALAICRPESVAVLGIAGGNGLDRIDTKTTGRIVGVDVNPDYLAAVQQRYSDLRGLELSCVDLVEARVELELVKLVHAALVFEHAGVDRCLDNALSLVASGGALSTVLQLPSETDSAVSASRFSSMQELGAHFSLLDPMWISEKLDRRKFPLIHQAQRPLTAGKAFWMGIFARK